MKKFFVSFLVLLGITFVASGGHSTAQAETIETKSALLPQSILAKVAKLPLKTNVMLTRASASSPWIIENETAISYTTISYVKSFKARG